MPYGPTGRPHSASRTCACGPIAFGTDMATAAPVYRHRTPPLANRLTPLQRAAASDFATFGLDAPWLERDEGDR